ncbi:MAG TPA: nitroreductase family protein [Polyangiaceae bacterium]|jgi:hypothetical protein
MLPHIERILDAARTAPSQENLQPWRFVVSGDEVSFGIDHERNTSPDQAMARVALGAAIECACVSAARVGATVRVQAPRDGALVTMSFTDPKRLPDPDLARTRRATNRRVYDGRALDDATLRALRDAVPQRDLAQTQWYGRERVRALGPLVEQAEELFYLDDGLRERALSAIRFDVKDRELVSRGLPLACLELQAAERAALVGIRKPVVSGVNASAVKTMAARARKQMESASGVLVITVKGEDPMTDVDVGRTMQRAWMALTQRGLAAHPMTKLITLGIAPSSAGTENDLVKALLDAFRRTFPNVPDDTRIAMLMRIGWAEAPSFRPGRYELAESCSEVDTSASGS